jgi:hypothetical protein
MQLGANFTRPAKIEVDLAEAMLELIDGADMVKFAKNGSDVTTAAVKLARAYTGREYVGICADQPFFSTDDWFIGTTEMNSGIPEAISRLTVKFRYNDFTSLKQLFLQHPGQIACVLMEAEASTPPAPGYLNAVKELCERQGAVLVFDEPTAGLDPIAAAEFRLMMKSFISREKHKTVLIASHNLWEVQQICDRVAVMKRGRVIATGSPSQISEEMEDRVSLTLVGRLPDGYSSEGLVAELGAVSGVMKCIVQPGQIPGQDVSVSVEGSKELDYTSVFATLLKKGFVILSLETSQPSLEEAFIKLAGEGTSWSHQWT